jgi:hypothetical protein
MPFVYVPDPPSYPFPPSGYDTKQGPHPDNIERALKLLDKLEKKRVKKDKDVKDKKKNTKERWIPNPDFEDKPRTFSMSELTAILMLLSFPLAIGQIFLYKWIETFLH